LVALNEGRLGDHDAAVLAAAKELVANGCGVIALAQFSMARAASLLRRELHVPVLTTPDSAIRRLQLRLQGS
jgi:aspartate/glutamate racemase